MPPAPISPDTWVTPDDYPPDAIRAEREGRVVAEVGVDLGGSAVSCRIAQSSGTTSLDTKTCELILARGRFDPATDARGRATASVYKLPIRWVMPQAQSDPAGLRVVDLKDTGRTWDVEQTIGVDGRLEACRIVARSDNIPDLCAQIKIGTQGRIRFTSAGEPVRVMLRTRHSEVVEAVKPAQ